ncbi:MAG: VWA domain-containing protein [Deltaproteobacteria bacterium]|nr:VWA domain-containing protein [Deltaproteobacteria bacterium]
MRMLIGMAVCAVCVAFSGIACAPDDDSGGPRDVAGERSDSDGGADELDLPPVDALDEDAAGESIEETLAETDDEATPPDVVDDDVSTDTGTDDAPGDGEPDDGGEEIDVAACYLDVVFVLDVSTSMTPILDALHSGIADVWTYAASLTPYAQFGLVVFVDDVRVTNSGAPYADVGALQRAFANWRSFCSTNDEPGGGGGFNDDCPENTIDALWDAVDGYAWRPEATRVIVFATDDTFVESPDTLGSYDLPVHHRYADLVTHLRDAEIRVATFAAHDSSNCAIPPVHDAQPGFYTSWGGTDALPVATGARVFDIMGVRDGSIATSEAINDVILEEYCTPYM